MNTIVPPRFDLNSLTAFCLAGAVSLAGYAPATAAHSNGAVWGIGGLLAGTMLGRATAHKHESQPTQSKSSTAAAAPASAPPMTAEQKMQQLNALAAGGYITPQEYKTEKQAILNQLAE
jgi:hypothetical protein